MIFEMIINSPARRTTAAKAPRVWSALLALLAFSGTPAFAVTPQEHQTLLDLFASTNGNGWSHHKNWGSAIGTECSSEPAKQWYGISCDENNNIAIVLLPSNHLTGTLPQVNKVPDLRGLPFVHYFDFDDNELSGELPPSLGQMTLLDTFHAERNQLTGPIPFINTLTAMQEFHLSGNFLTGNIPALSNLIHLGNIDLSLNYLSGPIPSLQGLTELREFDIEHNRVSGTIPSLDGLGALTAFEVGFNELSGVLPPVPSPDNALHDGDSTLCPNRIEQRTDFAWDDATGETDVGEHWYLDANKIPGGSCAERIFSDGFDGHAIQ